VDLSGDTQLIARLLLGLRAAGWPAKKINDFLLYIQSGDERYMPAPQVEPAE